MARKCTICTHDSLESIDAAIVGGEPNRRIASRFRVSEIAVRRHKANHLPKTLAMAAEAAEVVRAGELFEMAWNLLNQVDDIFDEATNDGNHTIALRAIREARGCLGLLAKMIVSGETNDTYNISNDPQWIEIREVIMEALEPFPDARIAIADAMARERRY